MPVSVDITDGAAPRRKVAKEVRRQQLILATINSIAKRGFADTTLAHVSKQAGLSQGIVNLHFNNKETLLVETLRYLRDDYRRAWEKALSEAGDNPADRVRALCEVDFTPPVCDLRKLAVWFAFHGEAKSRPTYRQICEEYDDNYEELLTGVLQELIEDGDYSDLNAARIAEMLTSLCEGLWLSMLTTPNRTTPQVGLEITMMVLAQFFPKHFSVDT